MRKTVPFFNVVPVFLSPSSASPVLFTGKDSVVHTTQADAPGRLEMIFLETSPFFTHDRPFASCPVTTRLTLTAIVFYLLDPGLNLFRLPPSFLHELRPQRFVPVWNGADLFFFQKPFRDLLQIRAHVGRE